MCSSSCSLGRALHCCFATASRGRQSTQSPSCRTRTNVYELSNWPLLPLSRHSCYIGSCQPAVKTISLSSDPPFRLLTYLCSYHPFALFHCLEVGRSVGVPSSHLIQCLWGPPISPSPRSNISQHWNHLKAFSPISPIQSHKDP